MAPERSTKLVQRTLDGKQANTSSSTDKSRKSSKSKSKSGVERVDTDAILTIKPGFAELIAKREKNHEYRKYHLKDTVQRIWLYETAPTSALTYVIETSQPKRPGEVNDPTGIGNDDFDKGLKQSKYGYPVRGLLRLAKPLSAGMMKQKYNISLLQGYCYAPKVLVDGEPLDGMTRVF